MHRLGQNERWHDAGRTTIGYGQYRGSWPIHRVWNVGVREFLVALTHAKIQRGVFVTLRGYTKEAKQFAEEHQIEILNETGLAKMLETTGANCDPQTLALLHDTRRLYPKCERKTVVKTAKMARGVGQPLWGCSAYPRCRYTVQL
jgi:restriction system protein